LFNIMSMSEPIATESYQYLYEALVGKSPEPVVVLDASTGRLTDVNSRAVHFFQRTREALLQGSTSQKDKGKSPFPIVFPDDQIERALEGESPVFEWLYQNREGHEVNCQLGMVRIPPFDKPLVKISILHADAFHERPSSRPTSGDRRALAMEAAALGSYDWYPLEGRLEWDKQMYKLYNLAAKSDKNKGEYFWEAIHPEDRQRIRQFFKDLLIPESTQDSFEHQYRIVVEGNIHHILAYGSIFRNDEGQVFRIIGTAQDITARKEAERQLQYQAALLNDISDAVISAERKLEETTWMLEEAERLVQLGSWDWNMRTNEIRWSEGLFRVFGRDPEAGAPPFDVFMEDVHPQDRKRLQESFTEAMNGKKNYFIEYRLIRPSDKSERYLEGRGEVMFNEHGQPERLIGSVNDITEQKHMEIALRKSEALYRSAIEGNMDAFYLLESVRDTAGAIIDFRFVEVNEHAAQQLARPKAELEGKLLCKDFPINVTAGFFDQYKRVVDTGEPLSQDYYMDKEDAALTGWYHHQVIKVEDGIAIMNRNITERKVNEQIIQESKERLNAAQRIARMGDFVWNTESGEVTWSDGLYHLLKYSPGDKIDYALVENHIHHPEDLDRLRHWLKEEVESGSAVLSPNEYRLICKDGEIIYVRTMGVIQRQADSAPIVFATVQDISERKQAELALRESEERFHSVFEQQFQFMAILSPDGRILEINDLPLSVTKYSKEDYLGKYFWEAPAWSHMPEWQIKIKEQVQQAADAAEPVQTEDFFQTADGEIRITTAAYSAIRDANQRLRYILIQATDITEQKLAEEALRDAKEALSEISQRFQISTKAAQIGIWEWDLEADVLIWDDIMYQLYRIKPEDFSGDIGAWRSSIHPDDQERIIQEIKRAAKEHKTFSSEFRIFWPNQLVRHIKVMASMQRNESGRLARMIGTNWDITKEKEAEQQKIRASQLELKNKELEQFAYVASHDLREPLRTIIGFVEVLQKHLAPIEDRKTKQYMDFISQAADRMNDLIRGLLDYSLIGRNKKLTRIDCNVLLHAVIEDLNAQVERTRTTFSIGALPTIMGFETELRVLFQNLISNAIKFRKEEVTPVIEVSAEHKEEYWEFMVKDNGIGIEERYQEKIFVIFQRLNPRANYEGSGIGLAHCQKIVDLHGGKIWLQSMLGQGSTFYFTIPVRSVGEELLS
jgi:PAS domain S-box-containing protein